jgi:hypothetical protein
VKTDKPFQKSFACAGVLLLAFVLLRAAIVGNWAYRFSSLFMFCLISAVGASIVGYLTKKPWTWERSLAVVIGFYLVLCLFLWLWAWFASFLISLFHGGNN